ncbi:uncharacterized protein LACBIDRAFT_296586 [Laccaria bicolor S238N-H82]|uniref:Predicted protein n=1 Tax=Laccaria bicolor (strain S238N-H82 / ATCC MYA-4686) TaxID=486041 RepID=B0D969_LACBS|nr:uncharacterized protein LACBIDRAFT_296586 [Laccaria bicolor S238N-H82]EDR09202.1 predicted protein [Laccaria bicolor S238N-H82]|eukprot:XP_001880515.1 predicted protein [Laccaria bicolor S238N-H82]
MAQERGDLEFNSGRDSMPNDSSRRRRLKEVAHFTITSSTFSIAQERDYNVSSESLPLSSSHPQILLQVNRPSSP